MGGAVHRDFDLLETKITEIRQTAQEFLDASSFGGNGAVVNSMQTSDLSGQGFSSGLACNAVKNIDYATHQALRQWARVTDTMVEFLQQDVLNMETANSFFNE